MDLGERGEGVWKKKEEEKEDERRGRRQAKNAGKEKRKRICGSGITIR